MVVSLNHKPIFSPKTRSLIEAENCMGNKERVKVRKFLISSQYNRVVRARQVDLQGRMRWKLFEMIFSILGLEKKREIDCENLI